MTAAEWSAQGKCLDPIVAKEVQTFGMRQQLCEKRCSVNAISLLIKLTQRYAAGFSGHGFGIAPGAGHGVATTH